MHEIILSVSASAMLVVLVVPGVVRLNKSTSSSTQVRKWERVNVVVGNSLVSRLLQFVRRIPLISSPKRMHPSIAQHLYQLVAGAKSLRAAG